MTNVYMSARLEKVANELLAMAKELRATPMRTIMPCSPSFKDVGDRYGATVQRVVETLGGFDVAAKVLRVIRGPTVTRIVFTIPKGIRYAAVTSLKDNLTGALEAHVRIEAPVCGEDALAVEVPRGVRDIVPFEDFRRKLNDYGGELPFCVGKKTSGGDLVVDLATLPHLFVGGSSGQGKTMFLNSVICSLIDNRSTAELRLILCDPRVVEFVAFAKLPHLLRPVITERSDFVASLNWAVDEMERRYKMFALANCRDISEFNNGADEKIPSVVIIVDELADWIIESSEEIVPKVQRLTAMSRGAGVHLILTTQRPDENVFPTTIKANMPGRIAFRTATSADSRMVLDAEGAEDLTGRGDLLMKGMNGELVRAQSAFVTDGEIASLVARAVQQYGKVDAYG